MLVNVSSKILPKLGNAQSAELNRWKRNRKLMPWSVRLLVGQKILSSKLHDVKVPSLQRIWADILETNAEVVKGFPLTSVSTCY